MFLITPGTEWPISRCCAVKQLLTHSILLLLFTFTAATAPTFGFCFVSGLTVIGYLFCRLADYSVILAYLQ